MAVAYEDLILRVSDPRRAGRTQAFLVAARRDSAPR
jgi:hypothetical protein